MADFSIETTKEEQDAIVSAIWKVVGETVSMSKLGELAGINKHRVRYIITDLLNQKRIKQIPTKDFGEHYKRYTYEVL